MVSHAASYQVDQLESRILLFGWVVSPDVVTYGDSVAGPLAPNPGHSFYVSGYNAQGAQVSQWSNVSAITPNVTNDLVLNVAPSSSTYQPQFDGGDISLLTNGITQTQIAPAASPSQPAQGDGGANDATGNQNNIGEAAEYQYSVTYQLGTAGSTSTKARRRWQSSRWARPGMSRRSAWWCRTARPTCANSWLPARPR
ncbi:MAG TPA: hypothetical protein VN541_22635 [Tepidisphaeraceae bacterium]|nr:hypothetical protein [Tepidisphaeraceae bacterium]